MKKILAFLMAFSLIFSLLAVSVSAAETEQRVLYDMETLDSITTHNGATAVQNNQWKNSGSYCLDFDGQGVNWDGTGETAAYVSFDLTGKLSGAVSLKTLWWFEVGNTSPEGWGQRGAFGVTYKGQNYWLYLNEGCYFTFATIEFSGRTYYTYSNADGNSGDSIVLNETTLPDVTALNIFVKTNDLHLIDDIAADYKLSSAPKATFDNGVADVEADAEGFVTLPEATIEGKQFIGWQDADGALYAAGAKVAIIEDTAFTAVAAAIDLQTGAGIRWAERETERGIRFETYVTKAALDKIGASNFELGALILPYADYNADITVETAADYGAINVVDPKVYGEVGENYRYYTGVVDFEKYFAVSQAALADLKLTAVSYVKVTYADASVGYFYAQPDATDNVRSVAEVARAALADTEFGYTDGQVAILNLYNQYSQETNVPEYRKDDADKVA